MQEKGGGRACFIHGGGPAIGREESRERDSHSHAPPPSMAEKWAGGEEGASFSDASTLQQEMMC